MFSISTRVAFSVLSIRTVSASAVAFSASAFAFLTVDFNVMMAAIVATRPPPSTRLTIPLSSIPFYIYYGRLIPISRNHFCTSKEGQALPGFSS